MPPIHRRDFLAGTAAAGAAVALSPASHAAPTAARPLNPVPKSPTDRVRLGDTGIEVSLIGIGTGSNGVNQASNQTKLGLKEFTRVIRHAFDSGIRFFDVADQYGSHTYLREALKGIPRDQYAIQTKTHARDYKEAKSHLERYRMELGVDYVDTLLLHCMTTADWPEQNAGAMEYISEAKDQGLVRAHGTSCHGMDPLRTSARHPWVEVDLARVNPEGAVMDSADPADVTEQLRAMHDAGKGVIGMKICGNGQFKEPERRDASLRFVFSLGFVDAIVVGLESPAQIDDLLARAETALDFARTQRA
ncbi:aldo/keto reductase [Tautonia sociabilis]|uniref:Aldo/keto reductase n=1 Tax=Tautonia sociabilis TaxID=2080755 RepID=A0A432MNQ2_9BACT|nr:aldo/keto reductase [Tautonia sociabilis]